MPGDKRQSLTRQERTDLQEFVSERAFEADGAYIYAMDGMKAARFEHATTQQTRECHAFPSRPVLPGFCTSNR